MLVDNALTSALYNVWNWNYRTTLLADRVPFAGFSVTNKTCHRRQGQEFICAPLKGGQMVLFGLCWLKFLFYFLMIIYTVSVIFLCSSYLLILFMFEIEANGSSNLHFVQDNAKCEQRRAVHSFQTHTDTQTEMHLLWLLFFFIVVAQDE